MYSSCNDELERISAEALFSLAPLTGYHYTSLTFLIIMCAYAREKTQHGKYSRMRALANAQTLIAIRDCPKMLEVE
jgi:hypothetical protein